MAYSLPNSEKLILVNSVLIVFAGVPLWQPYRSRGQLSRNIQVVGLRAILGVNFPRSRNTLENETNFVIIEHAASVAEVKPKCPICDASRFRTMAVGRTFFSSPLLVVSPEFAFNLNMLESAYTGVVVVHVHTKHAGPVCLALLSCST